MIVLLLLVGLAAGFMTRIEIESKGARIKDLMAIAGLIVLTVWIAQSAPYQAAGGFFVGTLIGLLTAQYINHRKRQQARLGPVWG